MLKPDRARKELRKYRLADWKPRRLAAVAALPRPLAAVGRGLLGCDAKGQPIAEQFAQAEARRSAAGKLHELSAQERGQLFEALFPGLGEYVAAGWELTRRLPYESGPDRKAFRAPSVPAVTRTVRCDWLLTLLEELADFEQPLSWYATWAGNLRDGYGAEAVSLLFAAALDAGTRAGEGEEVFETLCGNAVAETAAGTLSRYIPRALLLTARPECWNAVLGIMRGNDQHEGVRQSILSTLDEAHPGAFVALLRELRNRDLARFPDVVGSLSVWFGYHWDAVSGRVVNGVLERVVRYLDDPKERAAALKSADGETVYLALWALGFEDVMTALAPAARLLTDKHVERRFVAVHFLAQLQLPAARAKLLPALDDADLRVALCALEGCQGDGSEGPSGGNGKAASDLFERLERLLGRMPKEKSYLEPIVWPWHVFTADPQGVADTLADNLGERAPTRLLPYLPLLETGSRRQLVLHVTALKKWDDPTRAALFGLVGDPSITVREVVFKALARCKVTEAEAFQLEALLGRKTPDLRRGVAALLLTQKDRAVLASAERLLEAEGANERLGGLELLRQMVEAHRTEAACRARAEDYGNEREGLSPDEKKLLGAIRGAACG
jgi:hypothetical protein